MSCAGRRSTAVPFRRMLPALGRTIPEIARSSVVLPAPFAPTTAVIAPAATSNETSCSTATPS